jgi:hypothetical protein
LVTELSGLEKSNSMRTRRRTLEEGHEDEDHGQRDPAGPREAQRHGGARHGQKGGRGQPLESPVAVEQKRGRHCVERHQIQRHRVGTVVDGHRRRDRVEAAVGQRGHGPAEVGRGHDQPGDAEAAEQPASVLTPPGQGADHHEREDRLHEVGLPEPGGRPAVGRHHDRDRGRQQEK